MRRSHGVRLCGEHVCDVTEATEPRAPELDRRPVDATATPRTGRTDVRPAVARPVAAARWSTPSSTPSGTSVRLARETGVTAPGSLVARIRTAGLAHHARRAALPPDAALPVPPVR